MNKQYSDSQNAGDPVNAGVKGDLKSPTNWVSTKFRSDEPTGDCDNNSYKQLFPTKETRR